MDQRPIPLPRCDESAAIAAIDRLRAGGPAGSMPDRLAAAVGSRSVSEAVLTQHSRWCNTGGSYSWGIDAARDAARAMYGFVPERLVDESGRPVDDSRQLLAEYRRRLEARKAV